MQHPSETNEQFQLQNDCLIRALLSKPTSRTPIWIMRQAGRHLPEYREIRARAGNFMTLCTNPQLACEVTMQPIERYDLDAAILFSDILTIPDAMGLGLYFSEGEGPKFRKPLRTERDIEKLSITKTDADLPYVTDAIKLIRNELNGSVPLIGFAGSPWTLATYMIEGQSSRDFARSKLWLYEHPEILHQLLEKLSLSIIDYLNAQIASGAQVVQIFDTWGGVLSTPAYRNFSLAYMQKIVDNLIPCSEGREVPVILFTKGGALWLEDIAATGCHGIGLDWNVDIKQARARIGPNTALQGNMDPAILRASPSVIQSEVKKILQANQGSNGHIFNLGHGISPDIDPENVRALIEAVHDSSRIR